MADISGSLDMLGLMDVGLMDPKIFPLWKDIENFEHQMVGIAFTVRYVPTPRLPSLGEVSQDEYKNYRDQWYTNISGEPFTISAREML
ncbi:hypothetical protein PZB74_10505 [Porifericola rhodea]|uniref:hypothetical protein n=1 Tax=Porifericola rhodea TaxID=930972 RepID=UPI002666C777|nr:hypothetical protein [Porifericola rhodea]WKN33756.1 hypothetical protein PZB74_10505 [Porifericola rhodea]